MPCFRIVFANNEVISCTPTQQQPFMEDKVAYYEQKDGSLVFAIVKAENDSNAKEMAYNLMKGEKPQSSDL